MSETSLIFDLAKEVRAIFAAIDEKTSKFQTKTGLRCLQGCGKCCLSPTVEAHVSEMLPLAVDLLASGNAAALHLKLEQSQDPTCVLYRPHPQDPSKGYCSAYEMRPSVCRLFGFAAVSGKPPEKSQLSTCKIIKDKDPLAVKKATSLLEKEGDVPHVRDFSLRFETLAPGTAYSERLPINRAIKVALEKLAILPPHLTETPAAHEIQPGKSLASLSPSA